MCATLSGTLSDRGTRAMFYIKTSRGWRPLHKLHYEIAKSWQEKGWDVEEKVAKLSSLDYWSANAAIDTGT